MPGGGYSPEFDWDANKPAGDTEIQDGDNWNRSNQQHIDNAYAVEHYSPGNDPDASEDDYGRHDFVTFKEQGSKPSLAGSTDRHAIYSKSDGLYVEEEDGTETLLIAWDTNKVPAESVEASDIPSGETIVFDKNTAVSGYTLQTDVNDRLLFITKGSGAGGETGGANHSAGTWTISGGNVQNHTLTINEIPAHHHSYTRYSGLYAGLSGPGEGWGQTTSVNTGDTGSGGAHDHGWNHSGNWRPAARCMTRQTRN